MNRTWLATGLAGVLLIVALLSVVLMVSSGRQSSPVDLSNAFAVMGITPASSDAPEFSLASLSGDVETRLRDHRGQVVFLNFWATWCAPCVAEMPAMQRLYDRYRDDGLAMIAVNVREDRAQVGQFIDRLGVSYPVALDSDGSVTGLYNVRGFPTTVIIDREGRVMGVKLGYHDWAENATLQAFGDIMRMGSL
ncbi:MAG: TlpA family protein disulfide reductase [Spirochaetaceae bacterium]